MYLIQNVTNKYNYNSAQPTWSNHYIWPALIKILKSQLKCGARIMDLGCGSGATAGMMAQMGFSVTAVDPSKSGIHEGRIAYPDVQFSERSAYDDLKNEFGEFDAVVSLEVIEHCYWPRLFTQNVFSLVKPGGFSVISTPFHGYLKNLAIALAGKFDSHYSPLWDGGHIKFFSERTFRILLKEVGFNNIEFKKAGRFPPLAKSMIAVAHKA